MSRCCILEQWFKSIEAIGTSFLRATLMWSGVRAYRRKVLVLPIETRLKQIISEVCAEHQAEIEELEVMH